MRKTIRKLLLIPLSGGALFMLLQNTSCNKKTDPPEPQPVVGCIEATYLHSNTCGGLPIFNVETPDTTIKGVKITFDDTIKENAVVIINYDVFKETLIKNNKYYFTYRKPEKVEKIFFSTCLFGANPAAFYQLIVKEQFTTKCLK